MNECVIATGNQLILIRCAEHHPYWRSTSAPIVSTMRNAVLRLIHRLWRSPFPEGEGFGVSPLRPLFLQCGTWYCASFVNKNGGKSAAVLFFYS